MEEDGSKSGSSEEKQQPRQSSINTEPRTLTTDEMHHVKEVVTDVFHSMDPDQAMDELSKKNGSEQKQKQLDDVPAASK